MPLTPIENVIPESNIVVFSPHYDDFLFMLGGYIGEMNRKGLLHTKNFRVVLLFSRSNYFARAGRDNFDKSLERLKLVTGKRLLEDQECINELLGRYNYTYELGGEDECILRGKQFAESEMEFPHGMFEDFDSGDWDILARVKRKIQNLAGQADTALVFPLAFKEHMDHFIAREAAIATAIDTSIQIRASFYFQEDKPYCGIATDAELDRINLFIEKYKLKGMTYEVDPERVIDLAFRHYVTQVEEVYRTGTMRRAAYLAKEVGSVTLCDRIYRFADPSL